MHSPSGAGLGCRSPASSIFRHLDFPKVLNFLGFLNFGSGAIGLTRRAGQAGDPFDFAQGRLFAPPEERLRSGGRRRVRALIFLGF